MPIAITSQHMNNLVLNFVRSKNVEKVMQYFLFTNKIRINIYIILLITHGWPDVPIFLEQSWTVKVGLRNKVALEISQILALVACLFTLVVQCFLKIKNDS